MDTRVRPKVTVQSASTGKSTELRGGSGLFLKSEQIQVRAFDEGVRLDAIRHALGQKNNLDEVVFQSADGKNYVLYSDELVGIEELKEGDPIVVGDLKGKVLFVSDEWNQTRVSVAKGAALVGALAALPVLAMAGPAAIVADLAALTQVSGGIGAGAAWGWLTAGSTDDSLLRSLSHEVPSSRTAGWAPKTTDE